MVEDQDAVRQLASTILESYGYRVLQASNGPDAIALAKRYPDAIHLLLTDMVLPLMNGRVLADKLRAARPGIRVLYISGYTEDKIGVSGAREGDLAYLRSPSLLKRWRPECGKYWRRVRLEARKEHPTEPPAKYT